MIWVYIFSSLHFWCFSFSRTRFKWIVHEKERKNIGSHVLSISSTFLNFKGMHTLVKKTNSSQMPSRWKIPNLISLHVCFRVHMTKHYNPLVVVISFTSKPQRINVGGCSLFSRNFMVNVCIDIGGTKFTYEYKIHNVIQTKSSEFVSLQPWNMYYTYQISLNHYVTKYF